MKKPRFVSAKELREEKERKPEARDDLSTVLEKLTRIEGLLADVLEKLESLEERLPKQVEQRKEGRSEERGGKVFIKGREEKKSALDIMKDQGILFESDLRSVANKDRFFGYLSRHGVIVVEGTRERVAVTEEFLKSFKNELEKCGNPGEAEERLKGSFKRFYELLRASGYLLHDVKKGWILTLEKSS